jgi:threonine/homoserine/homoserine lactone efflux protein
MLFFRFLEVVLLGFLCGLIPGPVVSALFTETIRKGKRSARRVLFRAAVAEVILSVICVSALTYLHPQDRVMGALGIFGAMILLHVAVDLWRVREIEESEPLRSGLRAFTLVLLNGTAWVFWFTVCAPQALSFGSGIRGGQWLYVLFFELGWALSAFVLCDLFALFRPFFQTRNPLHLVYRTVAFFFVLFAGRLALMSGSALLQ